MSLGDKRVSPNALAFKKCTDPGWGITDGILRAPGIFVRAIAPPALVPKRHIDGTQGPTASPPSSFCSQFLFALSARFTQTRIFCNLAFGAVCSIAISVSKPQIWGALERLTPFESHGFLIRNSRVSRWKITEFDSTARERDSVAGFFTHVEYQPMCYHHALNQTAHLDFLPISLTSRARFVQAELPRILPEHGCGL